MITCFLFTQHLTEEGCLCLCLDQEGQLSTPLAQRSFSEIKKLQANANTIIVVPSEHFSLHKLELPWLSDKKARAAIPFALEDKLAQSVDSLHFAFARNYYQNGHYLIVVADAAYLEDLMATFTKQRIDFELLTLDWFALRQSEIAILDSSLLISDTSYQGALSSELTSFYLGQQNHEQTIYKFIDSSPELLFPKKNRAIIASQESCYFWLAQRLQKLKPINLCQGKLEHGSARTKAKLWYQAALGMSLLCLLCFIVINSLKIHFINQRIAEVDTKIAAIYHEFFPQAKQVISPKIRINQFIKTNQGNTNTSFWTLLDKLAKMTKNGSITIEQLKFQNQALQVTLATKDFASLEELETRLQQDKILVKQTQASTQGKQVISTLELKL